MNRCTWVTSLGFVVGFVASASAQEPAPPLPAPAAEACFPACREGYVCHAGQCVSACNPPCGPGERCTSAGECILPETTAPPAASAPPPYSPLPPPTAAPPVQGDTAIAPRSGPGFSLLLGFGPAVGWFYGGQMTIGGSIRLTDRLRLALGLHGGGGIGTGGDNAFVTGIGDVALRIENWSRFSGVGLVGAGFAYLGEFEDGLDYEYLAPHAVIGGGFMRPSDGRFAFGVEARGRFGYANNSYNYYCDDVYDSYYCEDYSGFYGMFEVVALLRL